MNQSNHISRYYPVILLLLCLAVAAMIILSSGLGYVRIEAMDILRVLAAKIFGIPDELAAIDRVIPYVLLDVRLPRILTAALVGGALALCGVIFQGILLNPLADPYTLGVSSGAAFGASVALVANLMVMQYLSVPLFAFVGAVLALLVVLRLSTFNGQMSANTLILSGVIVGAILAAGISFLKYMADEQVAVIIFWLMGSFAARTWADVQIVALVLVLSIFVFGYFARDLNIMSLGRKTADSLGVETARVRIILLVSASLLAAVCVAVSGIIGFVGLIIPHLMRFLVGPDNRRLLPASLLAGALLLLGADTLTRAVLPEEVPIGVLTALLGGPFFCVIFRKRLQGAGNG